MPLKMRPTGLGHGVYKDDVDYGVLLRRVVHRPHLSDAHRPRVPALALHAPSKPGEMRTSNQVATLEVAKAEFEASWKQWKAWANLEERD